MCHEVSHLIKPDSTTSQDEAVFSLERCISDICAWMTNNYIKLNDTKTEFLVIGSRQQLTKIKIDSFHVGSTEVKKKSHQFVTCELGSTRL